MYEMTLQCPGHRVTRVAGAFFLLVLLYLWLPRSGTDHRSLSDRVKSDRSLDSILNTTLGFEKILVVSLPTRTDRRDATTLSAAVTHFKIQYIDGVPDTQVLDKALPPGQRGGFPPGIRGSWRAHMNAIVQIVEQNLTSALIIEDDIDWDIRLKSQLQIFALASRALLQGRGKSSRASEKLSSLGIPPSSLPSVTPYGDDWDILWLGHCGFEYPAPSTLKISQDLPSKQLLPILIPNDATVPQAKYLKPHPFASPDPLSAHYPPHTRIVAPSTQNVCSLAYALTQTGARKLLYEFGIKQFTTGFDLMLRDFCTTNRTSPTSGSSSGNKIKEAWQENHAEDMLGKGICVTVQPPLFNHHYPAGGGASDIQGHGGGFITKMQTPYIRWSTRINLERLVRGEKEMIDQWPDEEEN